MATTYEALRNVSAVVQGQEATLPTTVQPIGRRLNVRTVFEEGQWVAVEDYTGMFGEGDTRAEAFADFVQGLQTMRHQLAADRDNLSDDLRERLAALEAVDGLGA